MSAITSNYSSVFPSEWILADEDGDAAPRSRSCSPPPNRDDSTPTPSTYTSKEPVPQAKPSTGYLDHFPDSWALPEPTSSPPPSPPLRYIDPAGPKTHPYADSDKLRERGMKALSANSLDRFQKAASVGGSYTLFALRERWQRDEESREILAQRRYTGFPDSFQRLPVGRSHSAPLRQKFMIGGTAGSAGTDVAIKPQNLLWLERAKQIEALKVENTLRREQSEQHNQYDDKDHGGVDAEDDWNSNIMQNVPPSESGYGDAPHRRPLMSDGYSTYTTPSVTH